MGFTAQTSQRSFAGGYALRDVATLLGLTAAQIRGYVRDGCVSPRRGPHGEHRFSFQDVVLLRTGKELMAALPARTVHRALRRLKDQLPRGRPLTALRLTAEGDTVVVRDGASAWNPESGQALLDFEVSQLATQVAPLARRAAEAARNAEGDLDAEDWYLLGCDLEPCDAEQARDAYRRALELAPDHVDARVNLGRLAHQAGDPVAAEASYRRALDLRPGDVTATFNLGVALEDLGRRGEALAAYQQAIASDPDFPDAHYNLARLYEQLGRDQDALRHLQIYRRLTCGA
ncbi:MAG TPA: tetratricopeptide repeat protein [Candidatus Eisenbacteria bacterium]